MSREHWPHMATDDAGSARLHSQIRAGERMTRQRSVKEKVRSSEARERQTNRSGERAGEGVGVVDNQFERHMWSRELLATEEADKARQCRAGDEERWRWWSGVSVDRGE